MNAGAGERLAVLLHEVRSPVAALAAIHAALRVRDTPHPTRRELVDLAVAAVAGIERIVTDAAVESVRLEDVDVAAVAAEVAAFATLRGASVRMAVARPVPVIRADPTRLRQALDNLVSNALGASPPGAEVAIGVRADPGVVLVSVTDTGRGIPPHEHERIFEPGVRLDAARSGSGIGLALARAVAEAHGGTLTVESDVGRGATFTLTLPLVWNAP